MLSSRDHRYQDSDYIGKPLTPTRRRVGGVRISLLGLMLVSVSIGNIASGAEAKHDGEEALPTLHWTGASEDNGWSNPANWKNDAPPDADERSLVRLGLGRTFTVTLDRDQTLRGGLDIGRFRSKPEFDLAGHTLTIASGAMRFGGPRAEGVIANGTLRLGSPSAAASLHLFDNRLYGGRKLVLAESLVIDPVNVAMLSVGRTTGNRTVDGVVDVSEARFVDDTLRAESLVVGEYRHWLGGYGSRAELVLPGTLGRVHVAELRVGVNHRDKGPDAKPSHATGLIDFGGGDGPLRLDVTRRLILSEGDNTHGELRRLPARTDLRLGAASAPAVMRIAHKNRTQGEAEPADNYVKGYLRMTGGAFTAHLSELRVGENERDAGMALGVLDLGDAEADIHVAGPVVIGPRGTVTLSVRSEAPPLTVSGDDAALRIDATASESEGEEGGRLRLLVHDDGHSKTQTGLRVAGDHTELLRRYVQDRQITATRAEGGTLSLTVRRAAGDTELVVGQ